MAQHTSHVTRHTSHCIRRREDEKSGVFKGGATAADAAVANSAAADAVTAAAAAAASESENSDVVVDTEGKIPFRTCPDIAEVEHSVMMALAQQR